jgi:predicted DNA-binding transcriptional regulator AlpA
MIDDNLIQNRARILKLYGEQERLIDEIERCHRTGISRTTWWRMQKNGGTPPASLVGKGKTRWLLSDILLWMNHSLGSWWK